MAVEPVPGRAAAILNRFSSLNEKVPVLVLAVWAWLYLPRPFQLGFYHDDWWSFVEATNGNAPFSLQRLNLFMGAHSSFLSRPVGGFLAFLLGSIGGISSFRYQACVAVLVLLAALSLRAWFRALMRAFDPPARFWAPEIATLFWLSAPWSFAGTAWPSAAILAVPAQIFFTEALRRVSPPKQLDARRLLIFGALLTASYLTYESFYFVVLLVIALYLAMDRRIREALWLSGVAVGTQVLVLGINRFMAGVNPEMAKKIYPAWRTLFLQSLLGLPHQMLLRMGTLGGIWAGLVLALAAAALVSMAVGLRTRTQRRATVYALGILLVGAGAIPVTILTYSVASYGVSTAGLESRTFFPVCWALTILVYGFVLLLTQLRWNNAGLLLLALPLAIIVLDSTAQRRQIQDLAHVWNQEREVLAHAPVESIKALPKDSRILFIGPAYLGDLVIFGAYWDITGAVFSLPPLNQGRQAYQGLTIMDSATRLYNWSWDGKNLVQELPGYWKETRPAVHLFVWNYDDGNRFFEAEAGFRWPAAP